MDIANVLSRRFPNTEWNLVNNDYAKLEWLSDTPKPTKKTLEGLWPDVESEIEAELQAQIEARESAIAKLSALGLSVAEIQAAFGLN